MTAVKVIGIAVLSFICFTVGFIIMNRILY